MMIYHSVLIAKFSLRQIIPRNEHILVLLNSLILRPTNPFILARVALLDLANAIELVAWIFGEKHAEFVRPHVGMQPCDDIIRLVLIEDKLLVLLLDRLDYPTLHRAEAVVLRHVCLFVN